MSDVIVSAEGLTKDYRVLKRPPGVLAAVASLVRPVYERKRALDSISFTVRRGEILGYIGPNGAGKSTTIKILAGILLPSGGRCTVFGREPFRYRRLNARNIGVVFGQRTQLWWNLPAVESLELMRYVYRIPADRFRRNLDYFTDLLDLGPFINSPVRNLSLGERMRAEFCAALLHDPELLFLDEPTIGLDIVAKNRIRALVKTIAAERNVTVLLTTHDLVDIEKLSTRVIILDKGRFAFDGALEELKRLRGTAEVLTVTTENDVAAEGLEAGLPATVGRLEPGRYEIRYDRSAVTPLELIERINARTRVTDFSLKETPIEDLICELYQSGPREADAAGSRPGGPDG
jgi:ABC-2 type transport system ATP-binding protein